MKPIREGLVMVASLTGGYFILVLILILIEPAHQATFPPCGLSQLRGFFAPG